MNEYNYTLKVKKEFEDFLDDNYGYISIGELQYWASQILKKHRPDYLESFYDYANMENIDLENIDVDLLLE